MKENFGRNILSRLRDEEQGAILAVSAIIFGVLVFFVIAFVVDDARVKATAIDLRAKTDSICKSVAYEPMWQEEAFKLFGKQVNFINSRLMYGAQIEEAKVGFSSIQSGAEGTFVPCPGSGCRWFSDISYDVFDLPDLTLWDHDLNNGNLVACKLTATIDGVLPGIGWITPREITATSVWSRPVVSASPFNFQTGAEDEEMPGLTIAVATQMTTHATDDRFIFSGAGDFPASGPYDPKVINTSSTEVYSSNSLSHEYPNGQTITSVTALTPLPPSFDEMLVACMNPALLVRNILLSTLVEMSARHGFLRSNTNILSVNSRDPDDSAPYVAPTVISNFGESLVERQYQHPYLAYPTGGAGLNPDQSAYWLDPFSSEFHSVLSGQLRFCHQLYESHYTHERLKRFNLPGLEYEGDFLPSEYSHTTSWPGSFSTSDWDSPEPWDVCPDSNSRCLTAGEVVGTLGASQACPTGIGCIKPPPGVPDDLRPDVLSTLRYITDGSLEALKLPGLGPIFADSSDNLIVPEYPYQPEEYTGFFVLDPDRNLSTHVVFVLHKPFLLADISSLVEPALDDGRPFTLIYIPTNDAELGFIDDLADAFFASESFSAGDEGLSRLYVFSPDEPIHKEFGEACESGNVTFCSDDYLDQSDRYQAYWEYLLNPDHRFSIHRRAKEIFLDRILDKRLKM